MVDYLAKEALSTRDHSLAELPEVQRGMKLILYLDGFDTFPTLL
jgi:hypothetical protein